MAGTSPSLAFFQRRYNTPCARPGPLEYEGITVRDEAGLAAFPEEMHMTAARFERSRDALVKDFADVLGEAEVLLKQASKETGERATDLRSQVETKLRSAKMRLADMHGDAMDNAKAAARATDDYVRDNPWQAI